MSASSPDAATAMTPSSSFASPTDVNRILRLGTVKSTSRLFSFPRKPKTEDSDAHKKEMAVPSGDNKKITNGFLKNIKKRLRIKNLTLCKAKQKIKAVDVQHQPEESESAVAQPSERPPSLADESEDPDYSLRVLSEDPKIWLRDAVDETLQNEADACWERYGETAKRLENEVPSSREEESLDGESRLSLPADEEEASVLRTGNVAEPQSTTAKESVEDGVDAALSNESKAKANLSEELLKLSKYGWYWGPISGDEADSKLVSEPDGAFLVRDSSDDRYLLTLSFKSSGRLLHARMEHSGGLFSLYNQNENEGFTSVPALIDHSMNSSQSAVFCYSRPRFPGHPSFPVRLTKPVSRFTQVRSLQYLCRFVIRQNTRLDNIHKLPLPKTIRGYIEEAHY